jgi:hypothetical protein
MNTISQAESAEGRITQLSGLTPLCGIGVQVEAGSREISSKM